MSVIDKLRQKNDFTGVECEIADYILAHANEVTTMNIGALAQAAYTSNATIIRLCHKIGVGGYRDFRIELARELEKRLLERRTIDVDTPVLPNQETAEIMSSIAALSKQVVDTCYASVSTTDVRRIALAIRRAHHVYLYARGDSNLSTRLFANQLMKLGIFCIDAMGLSEGPANANTAQRGDLGRFPSLTDFLPWHRAPKVHRRGPPCRALRIKRSTCPYAVSEHGRRPYLVTCRKEGHT